MSAHPWSIIVGDSLVELEKIPAGSIDAVITDPPYSSGGQFRGDRERGGNAKYVDAEYPEFEGDTRDGRAFHRWMTMWLISARQACRSGAFIAVFTDWRQLPTVTDAVQCAGWIWRGVVPWVKPHPRPQLGRPSNAAEYVVWGSKGPIPWAGSVHPGEYRMMPPKQRQHPTEKPIDLLRGLCRLVPEGSLILDPFAGSGTTLAAAVLEGRRALGIELSADYAKIATNRCEAADAGRDRFAAADQVQLFGGA